LWPLRSIWKVVGVFVRFSCRFTGQHPAEEAATQYQIVDCFAWGKNVRAECTKVWRISLIQPADGENAKPAGLR
jgi:hypothetical protein